MRRAVLCEGPDDVAALRELSISLFGATVLRRPTTAGPAGESRQLYLTVGQNEIVVTACRNGKSGLPGLLVAQLSQMPIKDRPEDPYFLQCITVLFDPDDEPSEMMYARLAEEVSAKATAWRLEGRPGDWSAHRNTDETVSVRAIPWRSPGDVVDGLPDKQNLERLLCHVAATAYPNEARIVERWLGEIPRGKQEPSWKAALHLWCALIEPKASESTAPARFLHQNQTCQPHVRGAIEHVSLLRDLSAALGLPRA